MKKVLVCCGNSIITSTVASNKLKNGLAALGIEIQTSQCKFSDVTSLAKSFKPDVIVPTGPMNTDVADGVPIIIGTPLITGVGAKAVIDKVAEVLKN